MAHRRGQLVWHRPVRGGRIRVTSARRGLGRLGPGHCAGGSDLLTQYQQVRVGQFPAREYPEFVVQTASQGFVYTQRRGLLAGGG